MTNLTEAQARVLRTNLTSTIPLHQMRELWMREYCYLLGEDLLDFARGLEYPRFSITPAGRAALEEYERAESQGSRSIKAK